MSDLDTSVLIVCRDDEEHVGHLIRRVAGHLAALELRYEILLFDEGSGDNSLALLSLLKRELPQLDVFAGVDEGRGFVRGAELARGRTLLLLDARSEAPFSAVGFALQRIREGADAVIVAGRYLVLHRIRALRAHDTLVHHRDTLELERRFVRRARSLGLEVAVAARPSPPTPWARIRNTLLSPIASSAR